MNPGAQPDMTPALDLLWARFLPQIEERVAVLEAAASAFAADRLSIEQREAANAAAHNLAGVLGTFGLTEGTVLARELEVLYSRPDDPDPAIAPRLASVAAHLHDLVEGRK